MPDIIKEFCDIAEDLLRQQFSPGGDDDVRQKNQWEDIVRARLWQRLSVHQGKARRPTPEELTKRIDMLWRELRNHLDRMWKKHRNPTVDKSAVITPAAGSLHSRPIVDSPKVDDQAEGTERPAARHSPDFRSVHWFGADYALTATQAACVKVLWLAWENRTPDVGQATILEEVEADSKRLLDVFKGSPAWGTMIGKGQTAGTYRLAESPPKT